MLFLSEDAATSLRDLAEKLEDPTVDTGLVMEQILAIDPTDRIALLELSRRHEQSGDLAGAESLCRRGMAAHPCDYHFYLQLVPILTTADVALLMGLTELGLRKLLITPDAPEDNPEYVDQLADVARKLGAAPDLDSVSAIESFVSYLSDQRAVEPLAVSSELMPYRLIDGLQEANGNELDEGLVNAILREASTCGPLLVGVLRGVAQDYLPEGSDLMGQAALALLGEIGDPESLPALVQFGVVDNQALSDIASWAVLRIASQNPAGTVAKLRDYDPQWGGERAFIADALASMPKTPGKLEALQGLLENFGAVPADERSDVFLIIVAAVLSVGGKPVLSFIRQARQRLKPLLSPNTGPQVDELLKAYAADPSAFVIPPEEDVQSVYDICCADRTQEDEEDEDEAAEGEHVHVHGPGCAHVKRPGRNDPCWCGSGQKYKKCHLAADEAARPN